MGHPSRGQYQRGDGCLTSCCETVSYYTVPPDNLCVGVVETKPRGVNTKQRALTNRVKKTFMTSGVSQSDRLPKWYVFAAHTNASTSNRDERSNDLRQEAVLANARWGDFKQYENTPCGMPCDDLKCRKKCTLLDRPFQDILIPSHCRRLTVGNIVPVVIITL